MWGMWLGLHSGKSGQQRRTSSRASRRHADTTQRLESGTRSARCQFAEALGPIIGKVLVWHGAVACQHLADITAAEATWVERLARQQLETHDSEGKRIHRSRHSDTLLPCCEGGHRFRGSIQ